MANPTNSDIMRALGGLEEGQKHATESRRVTHEKLDATMERLDVVSQLLDQTAFTLQVTTDIAVQARDGVASLRTELSEKVTPQLTAVESFHQEAEPIVKVMKNVRNAVVVMIGLLATGGVLTTGTLVLANDYAKQLVREWLEIDVGKIGIVPNVE